MADHLETIQSLFDQQADNYSSRDIDGMLDHYAPEKDLVFWTAEGALISSHESLKAWYEALFAQFEIISVKYRIESCWGAEGQIVTSSIWQFETKLSSLEGANVELQSLKATHLLKPYDREWKIVHIHASPIGQSSID